MRDKGADDPALRLDNTATAPLGPFASINNLREISRRCLADEPIDRRLGVWLGDALRGYLSHQYRTVEEALGLCFPRGGIPWWREEVIRTRDAALRRLAEVFHPELSAGAQAGRIYVIARRYAASAWRIDRQHEDMPDHYRGTAKECLWFAFTSGAAMPISERQLRNILAR